MTPRLPPRFPPASKPKPRIHPRSENERGNTRPPSHPQSRDGPIGARGRVASPLVVLAAVERYIDLMSESFVSLMTFAAAGALGHRRYIAAIIGGQPGPRGTRTATHEYRL